MKLIDLTNIVANRLLAGAVDRDTATEQVRVLCQQFGRDPHDFLLEVVLELARTKSALAAKNRKVQ
ncbi:MAG: hypothetical protein QM754_06960 [Tepidisphaeraceae bacterium]